MNHEQINAEWWEQTMVDYCPEHYNKKKKTKWDDVCEPFRQKEKVNKPKRGTRKKSIGGGESN